MFDSEIEFLRQFFGIYTIFFIYSLNKKRTQQPAGVFLSTRIILAGVATNKPKSNVL